MERPSRVSEWFTRGVVALDRRVGWHKLPPPIGILMLIGLRNRLREKNFFDTGTTETAQSTIPTEVDPKSLNVLLAIYALNGPD